MSYDFRFFVAAGAAAICEAKKYTNVGSNFGAIDSDSAESDQESSQVLAPRAGTMTTMSAHKIKAVATVKAACMPDATD